MNPMMYPCANPFCRYNGVTDTAGRNCPRCERDAQKAQREIDRVYVALTTKPGKPPRDLGKEEK